MLKDAPSGTVIIDNGSEITDAGIQTQLKMIEELGRGKYRRAPSRKRLRHRKSKLPKPFRTVTELNRQANNHPY